MPPAPQDLAPGVVKPSPPVSGGNTTQQALLRPDTASIVPACPRPTQGRSAESPGRPLGLGGSLAGVPNSRCAGQGEDRHMCPTPSLPQHDDITSEVTLHHRYQWVDRACTRHTPASCAVGGWPRRPVCGAGFPHPSLSVSSIRHSRAPVPGLSTALFPGTSHGCWPRWRVMSRPGHRPSCRGTPVPRNFLPGTKAGAIQRPVHRSHQPLIGELWRAGPRQTNEL